MEYRDKQSLESRTGVPAGEGYKVVVLTRGMQLRLQTCPETLQLLQDKGIRVHVRETKAAAELYNKLAESELVG